MQPEFEAGTTAIATLNLLENILILRLPVFSEDCLGYFTPFLAFYGQSAERAGGNQFGVVLCREKRIVLDAR
jgi:hypothetical protein